MVVGVLRLTLYLPENHSLKGKRQVLRAIKARVRDKFNVSIAESDHHDMWQRSRVCGFGAARSRELYRETRTGSARRRATRNHQLLRGRATGRGEASPRADSRQTC
jgi:hypothetical protein